MCFWSVCVVSGVRSVFSRCLPVWLIVAGRRTSYLRLEWLGFSRRDSPFSSKRVWALCVDVIFPSRVLGVLWPYLPSEMFHILLSTRSDGRSPRSLWLAFSINILVSKRRVIKICWNPKCKIKLPKTRCRFHVFFKAVLTFRNYIFRN